MIYMAGLACSTSISVRPISGGVKTHSKWFQVTDGVGAGRDRRQVQRTLPHVTSLLRAA